MKAPVADLVRERETKAPQGARALVGIERLVDVDVLIFDPQRAQGIGNTEHGLEIIKVEPQSEMNQEGVKVDRRTDLDRFRPRIPRQQRSCACFDLGIRKVRYLQTHGPKLSFRLTAGWDNPWH